MTNQRIVVKIGTSTLAHPSGLLNIRRVEELCKVLSDLKNAGHEILLVSSGAIGMGVGKLSLAIIRGNFVWNDASLLISSEPVCLVRSNELRDSSLSEATYIGHRTDPDEERRIEQWMIENQIAPNNRLWIDDISTCREMAQAGVGWTIIPSICLDNFVGDIMPLSLQDGTLLLRNTYVLYRSAFAELQQVKLFISILQEMGGVPHPSLSV